MRKIAIGLAAAALATGVPVLSANASPAVRGSVPAIQGGDDASVDLAHYYGRGYYRHGYYGHRFYPRYYGYYGRQFYPRYYGYYGRGYYGRPWGYRHRFY